MKKILANDGIDPIGKQLLEHAGFTVITDKVEQQQLAKSINDNGIMGLTVRSATKVRKELIDLCPSLKLIGRGGVGMDNIDVEYALSKGIHVVNTPAASSHSVAELVFAHLFSAVRFLYDSHKEMPLHGGTKFEALKKKYAKGTELSGKTLGIIGFGRIGQEVAKLALGLGMKVLFVDRQNKTFNLQLSIFGISPLTVTLAPSSLEEVLTGSDFITVHVPGGQVIGKDEFQRMKPGVILINTARGGVINELALLQAINEGKVSMACLDVFENEPTPLPDLLTHPMVSLTPHIGAATEEAQQRIGVELAELIIAKLK